MPTKGKIDRRAYTAYHEAGHAVIAHLHRRPFRRVSIVTIGEAAGRVETSAWRGHFDPEGLVTSRDERRVMTMISVAVAGHVAVCLLEGTTTSEGAERDFEHAYGLASKVSGSPEEADALVEWLRARVRNELSLPDNWAAVKALAEALLAQPEIGVRRAKQIINAAIAPGRS